MRYGIAKNKKMISCPLCLSPSSKYYSSKSVVYYKCNCCLSVFVDPSITYSKEEEKERYEKHNNDPNDKGYLSFVSPIVNEVMSSFNKDHKGLDFGSGNDSAVSDSLLKKGYDVKLYDPFFKNDEELLNKTYDYIVCCEVIEHFSDPAKEFKILKSLLNKNGKLICMTNLYSEKIEFPNWYYKNDFTHRFFYHKKAFEYIKVYFGFCSAEINENLIVLR